MNTHTLAREKIRLRTPIDFEAIDYEARSCSAIPRVRYFTSETGGVRLHNMYVYNTNCVAPQVCELGHSRSELSNYVHPPL